MTVHEVKPGEPEESSPVTDEEDPGRADPVGEGSASGDQPSGGQDQPSGQEAQAERAVELEARLRRVLADFDNLRKRFEREVARQRAEERLRTSAAWLPIVDDLERALQHPGSDVDAVLQGVGAVHEHATAVLDRLGFPRFEDLGLPFDSERHEAVGAVEADQPAGTIVTSVRPGYGSDEQILRPAGVMVAKN